MDAAIIELADLIAAVLNGTVFSPAITTVREWLAEYQLSDVETSKCVICPKEEELANATRTTRTFNPTYQITVMKRLAHGDAAAQKAELDSLAKLVQDMRDLLIATSPADTGGSGWIAITTEAVYVPQHLKEWRQFTSIMNITYRLER